MILFIFYAVQESPNILRDGYCPIGSIAVGFRLILFKEEWIHFPDQWINYCFNIYPVDKC